ncbi:hypothetical protein F4804DRAFT_353880, partial [Jackrogersella minutella]
LTKYNFHRLVVTLTYSQYKFISHHQPSPSSQNKKRFIVDSTARRARMEQSTETRSQRTPLPSQEEAWQEAQRTDPQYRPIPAIAGAYPEPTPQVLPATRARRKKYWNAQMEAADELEEMLAEVVHGHAEKHEMQRDIFERQQALTMALFRMHRMCIVHMEAMYDMLIEDDYHRETLVPARLLPLDMRQIREYLELLLAFQLLIILFMIIRYFI